MPRQEGRWNKWQNILSALTGTRVWTIECGEMRIFTQIRPTFIYLESDNLASALTQSSMSPGTSAQDLHRDQALSFYCGQGRKWGEEGVTISSVRTGHKPLTSAGGRCQSPVSWLTRLITILPSPSASPAQSLAGLHICRENICWAQRARGRMRPPGGNGEPGSEGLVARAEESVKLLLRSQTPVSCSPR